MHFSCVAGKQRAFCDGQDEEKDEVQGKMDDDVEEVQRNRRLEKKRRLKERFDAEYDDGDSTYFDDLKEEMQKQAEVEDFTICLTGHSFTGQFF